MNARTAALHSRMLAAIRACLAENGYPPSVRELGRAVGLRSPSAVAYQLAHMQRRGLIERDPVRSRAIRIVPPAEEAP